MKTVEELEREISRLKEAINRANGTVDLLSKHRDEAEKEVLQLRADIAVQREALEKASKERWQDGCPDRIYGSDWFMAILDTGERVVLRQLPEEFSYDYKTADDTYYSSNRIKKWMPFLGELYI